MIKDVSVLIETDMPVWPGDDPVQLYRRNKIEDGKNANVSFLALSVHTGTHIDAPFHFIPEGAPIEQIPMDLLIGEAQVIEIPDEVKVIDSQILKHAGMQHGVTRILFKTSNSKYWEREEKEFKKEFVAISEDGAKWLADFGIKTIGIDYLSIAPFGNSRPTHTILLSKSILVIEGLNLTNIDPGIWMMYCLPLKLKGADGAPARVVLTKN